MRNQPADFQETIAVVGQATLIKRLDGRYELLDCGSEADREEILAWVAFHLKDVQVVIK